MQSFPLSPNGKVDRARLADLEPSPESAVPAGPPRRAGSSRKARFATLWPMDLGLDRIGVEDNFFDLGASSLDLIRIHAKIVEAFGPVLTAVDLFAYPNVDAVAAKIDGACRWPDDIHFNRRTRAQALCRAPPHACHRRQDRRGMSGATETEGRIAIVGMSGRFPDAPTLGHSGEFCATASRASPSLPMTSLKTAPIPRRGRRPVTSKPARCSRCRPIRCGFLRHARTGSVADRPAAPRLS